MKVSIRDRDALLAVSPAALSAYARTAGWSRQDPYRVHSDVYIGEGLPEIIVPQTEHLGDYASVVATLIDTFAAVAEQDETTVYRDLVTADRDVVRVRAIDHDHSGSLPVGAGADLVCGARDMILAAACSLVNPRPFYRPGANREAADYLGRVRLGQTDQGSFVVTLLSPVVSPPIQMTLPGSGAGDDPFERRITRRLAEALAGARQATDDTNSGDAEAFPAAVRQGVSANLCDALVTLTETLSKLDVSVVWARTHPRNELRTVVRFAAHDGPILREASRALRSREPQPGVILVGLVQRLARSEADTDGTVTLRTSIDGQNQSVVAVLPQADYHRAIQAHKQRAPVVMRGDLERMGQRWRLLGPSIEDVIMYDESSGGTDTGNARTEVERPTRGFLLGDE